jgi:peptidyl-prolyl cis-trans isomerase B (cyclophilin B)
LPAPRLLAAVLVSLLISWSCNTGPEQRTAEPTKQEEEKSVEGAVPTGIPHALLETDKGTIVIKLLPEVAPKTVDNFIGLVNSGFYFRTKFHRVMPGAMIQGGDPYSKDNDPYNDGQGNSGKFIPAEFSSKKFERGVVAMARQEGDPDSASCQFFIVLKRTSHWDGQYTVFGEVVEGLQVADEISRARLSKDPRLKSWPVENIRIRSSSVEYR